MKIGELSKHTGATGRMLRYYEQHGLLGPRRTDSGYRAYSENDILRVQYIRCMLSAALPTQVIASALHFLLDMPAGVPSIEAERQRVASALETELTALTERITLLEGSRQQLARLLGDIRGEVVGPPLAPAAVSEAIGPTVRPRGPAARPRTSTRRSASTTSSRSTSLVR
jgi:DNA-binding transcriptional MerR regulator